MKFRRFGAAVCMALAVALCGCVSASYTDRDGRRVHYLRVGSTKFEGLTVTKSSESLGVEMAGYGSEGAGLAEAVARGAVQGAASVIKP